MIPFAILSGQLIFSDQKTLEIRVLDLSVTGFTFRISKKHHTKKISQIRLSFYDDETDQFQACILTDFNIMHECLEEGSDAEAFYDTYRIETAQPEYALMANRLTSAYMRYIELKLSSDDAALSKELTGYPAELEQVFPENIEDFRNLHLGSCRRTEHSFNIFDNLEAEIAISLMTSELLNAFITMPFQSFKEMLTKTYYHGAIPVNDMRITHLYIGHPVSFTHYPDEALINNALKKTDHLGLIPVIVIPPLRGIQFDEMVRRIEQLLSVFSGCHTVSGNRPEFLVNDWGMAHWLHEHLGDHCHLILGTLLNKRRKDVRMLYKKNNDRLMALLLENTSNADFYQQILSKDFGITSYAYDSTGYPQIIPEGSHELHLPYYVMNTEGFKSSVRLYPSFLPMIGVDGNLWGLDTRLFSDTDYQNSVLDQNIHRIILEVI